jgi:hypothetical protein
LAGEGQSFIINLLVFTRHVLAMAATWLPVAALVALPLYMRPLRLGPIGLPLHELLIWLGLGAAVGYWVLSEVQRPMSGGTASAAVRDAGPGRFLDTAALLLLVIGFFAALNAAEKGYAFYDWRVTFLTPAVFYFLITRFTLRRAGGVRLLGQGALLGGVLVSGIALWQFFSGQAGVAEGVPRVQALYGSANNLALVLGRLLPLAVALTFCQCHSERSEESHGYNGGDSLQLRSGDSSVVPLPQNDTTTSGNQWGRRIAYGLALLIIAAAGFLTFSKGLLFISIPVGLATLTMVNSLFQTSLLMPAVSPCPISNGSRTSPVITGRLKRSMKDSIRK